jgi:hypothetical protein
MVYFFDNQTLVVEINTNPSHCVELARLHFSPGGGRIMRPVPEPRKAMASVPSLRYGPALREPGTGQEFFFVPREKNKGRGPRFLFNNIMSLQL